MLVLVEDFSDCKKCSYVFSKVFVSGVIALRIKFCIPVNASEKAVLKNTIKVCERLKRLGDVSLCFNNNFLYRENFLQYGFGEVTNRELICQKAGDIVSRSNLKKNKVFVSLGALGVFEIRALAAVANKFRYIEILVPDSLIYKTTDILLPYGISPIISADVYTDSDAAIIFSPLVYDRKFKDDCAILNLCNCNAHSGMWLHKLYMHIPERFLHTPKGYRSDLLLAYALQNGAVEADEISVISTEFKK